MPYIRNDKKALFFIYLDFFFTESLNNSECHWNSSGLQHTNPQNTVTTKTLHNELLRSSGSQTSIATQDIEYSMIELNFGSPLNNLNK